MNKRLDSIRSLFTVPAEADSARSEAPEARPRVTAGVVHAIKDTFSAIEGENQALRERLSAGDAVLDIDPALIDASFARDRMVAFEPEGADAGFVSMIRDQGQLVPALLRPNPDAPGRYQPAYGRRRIGAAAFLGRKVRAVVRNLTNEELVVAQGQENEARNGLTFIEKCRFAATLEAQGFKRKVIMASLAVAESNLSVMLQIVESLPGSVIDWIGPAPGTGRRRWLELATRAKAKGARAAMARLVEEGENLSADKADGSDARFNAIMAAASEQSVPKPPSTLWALPGQKKTYGSLEITPRRVILMIDRAANSAIADTFIGRIEELRRELENAATSTQPKKG